MNDEIIEGACCEEDLWASVIAGRAAPPILEPAEHYLNLVAPFVSAFVVFDGSLALLPARDTRAYPFILQRFSEPVSVMTAIPQQPFDVRRTTEQRPCADVIADLSDRDEQVDRSSQTVTDSMQLGVHTALRSTDQAAAPPFFTPMLVAVRWASR